MKKMTTVTKTNSSTYVQHSSANIQSDSKRKSKVTIAKRILKRYGDVELKLLTDKQRESIKWAESILDKPSKTQLESNARQSQNAPLKRTLPSISSNRPRKRPKVEPPRPKPITFNKVVAILDKSCNSLPPKKWDMVETALSSVYLKVMKENPGSPPCCKDMGWYHGRCKLIGCSNNRSVFLLTVALKEIGQLWENAKLVAVYKEDLIAPPHAKACIPSVPSDTKTILEMIQTSNPELYTEDWKVVHREKAINGWQQVTFRLDAASMLPLRDSKNIINYGFSTVQLYIYHNEEEMAKIPDLLKEKGLDIPADITATNNNENGSNITTSVTALDVTEIEDAEGENPKQDSDNLNTKSTESETDNVSETQELDLILISDVKESEIITIDDDDDDEENIEPPDQDKNLDDQKVNTIEKNHLLTVIKNECDKADGEQLFNENYKDDVVDSKPVTSAKE